MTGTACGENRAPDFKTNGYCGSSVGRSTRINNNNHDTITHAPPPSLATRSTERQECRRCRTKGKHNVWICFTVECPYFDSIWVINYITHSAAAGKPSAEFEEGWHKMEVAFERLINFVQNDFQVKAGASEEDVPGSNEWTRWQMNAYAYVAVDVGRLPLCL